MSRSTESSPGRKIDFVASLLDELKADGVETSTELEGFLQAQYSKKEELQKKVIMIQCVREAL